MANKISDETIEYVGIWRTSELGAATTENLCLCRKFYVNLKSNDCLILLCHNYLPSFTNCGAS